MNYYQSLATLILRLGLGVMILLHGVAKIMHPGTLDFIGGKLSNFGLPGELAYLVYLGEILAPLMVIFGYFNRLGAIFIIGNMLAAIILVHSSEVFSLTDHGGWAIELQGMFLLAAVAVALLGTGKYALRPD
ncbi:MAG: DoxX family protein [Gammaproteobacteria bacterium]|nr:MAG: DoxX family protein [Gammaproteobacteria bacterium]